MPIIPKDPAPSFGADNFNSIQGVTITGAFEKYFARTAVSLSKTECEQMFNNQEPLVNP